VLDLAEIEAVRTRLPYTTARADFTVSTANRAVYLNGVRLNPTDALDLSVALRVAAERGACRSLPVAARCGHTVSVSRGVIYLTARPLTRADALDLSVALVCALNDTIPSHTREPAMPSRYGEAR